MKSRKNLQRITYENKQKISKTWTIPYIYPRKQKNGLIPIET